MVSNRRGQGLPLNTIIIAIIVIVVLVVIILIFTGQLIGFGEAANACVQRGGYCTSACDTSSGLAREISKPGTGVTDAQWCTDDRGGRVCCAGIGG